jgi:hypothetical protein
MQHLTEIDTEVIYQIYLLSKRLFDKRHPEKRYDFQTGATSNIETNELILRLLPSSSNCIVCGSAD